MAQVPMPVWSARVMKTENDGRKLTWRSVNGEEHDVYNSDKIDDLNGQPTIPIQPNFPIEEHNLKFSGSGVSIFVVYRDQAPGLEHELWRLTGSNEGLVTCSNRRVFYRKDQRSRYFKGLGGNWPRIADFHFGTSTKENQSWSFEFGGTQSPRPFIGEVAEVLVFSRVLSTQERLEVNTRLALVYGIPLFSAQELKYQAQEKTLWNAPAWNPFRHRISGIGNCDSWQWKRTAASSSFEPGVLTVNTSPFGDEETADFFLLWGDNGESLIEENIGPGVALKRKWRIVGIDWPVEAPLTLSVDTRKIAVKKPTFHRWWLAVDTSGSGEFRPGKASFFPGMENEKGKVQFQLLSSEIELAKGSVFTFYHAPNFFLHAHLAQDICSDDFDLEVAPIGGVGPYRFRLLDNGGQEIEVGILSDQQAWLWLNQKNQVHRLEVVDAEGSTATIAVDPVTDRYRQLHLQPTYHLGQQINPISGFKYTWSFNGRQTEQTPPFTTTTPGNGEITVDHDGCRFSLPVLVAGPKDPVLSIVVFNSLSKRGDFGYELTLDSPSPFSMSLLNNLGQVIFRKSFGPRSFHRFANNNNPLTTGTYQLIIEANGFLHTHTIVVQ
jgi:hypothetical protein